MDNEELKVGDVVKILACKEFENNEHLHKYIGALGIILETDNKDDFPPLVIDTSYGEIAVFYDEVMREDAKFVKRRKDYKVVYNKPLTTVVLNSGETGIAKCLLEDEYDVNKGFRIAFLKASIKKNNKKLKILYNDYFDLLSDTDDLEEELCQLCT